MGRICSIRTAIVCTFLSASLVLLVSCGSGKKRDVDVNRLFGSDAAMAPVIQPAKIEAFRVDPKQYSVKPGVNNIGGFAISSGPVDVGRHTSPELSQLFTSKSSYKWHEAAPKCDFLPTIGIRFIDSNNARTDLLLAFNCNEMAVYHQGLRVGTGYFDNSRAKVIEILKRLFPRDGYVKKL